MPFIRADWGFSPIRHFLYTGRWSSDDSRPPPRSLRMHLFELANEYAPSPREALRAGVPEWALGCFRRRGITFFTGAEDVQTEVIWLQSRGLTADFGGAPPAHGAESGRAGGATARGAAGAGARRGRPRALALGWAADALVRLGQLSDPREVAGAGSAHTRRQQPGRARAERCVRGGLAPSACASRVP